jgi:hypothetical protein
MFIFLSINMAVSEEIPLIVSWPAGKVAFLMEKLSLRSACEDL